MQNAERRMQNGFDRFKQPPVTRSAGPITDDGSDNQTAAQAPSALLLASSGYIRYHLARGGVRPVIHQRRQMRPMMTFCHVLHSAF
jgi:hypothetical protein